MKIAITGASGYIGRHIAALAKKNGYKVVAIDRSSDIDIFAQHDNIFEALQKPDVLLHLAWRDGFRHNSPEHMKNLSHHYDFLRSYINSGGKNVAVMGSMHEVGYWEGAIDEQTPCDPLSQYGVAKNALRQSMMLLTKDSDISLYWLRGFYIYGDDMGGHSIFSKIAQAAADGKTEFPFTTGKNKYDFLHIDEFSDQVLAAITQDKVTGIINICSGKPVSLAERVEQYIQDNHYHIKLQYGAFPDRPYDSPAVWGDDSKIRMITG